MDWYSVPKTPRKPKLVIQYKRLCKKIIDFARKLLLPILSLYSAECGFSAVNNLLLKNRNQLDVTISRDLRIN